MEKEKIGSHNQSNVTDDQVIVNLQKKHELELSAKRDWYEQKIKNLDQILMQAVVEENRRVKESWTWRVGSIVVAPAILMAELFRFIVNLLPGKSITTNVSEPKAVVRAHVIPEPEKTGETVLTVDPDLVLDPEKLNIGCIFDVFTYNCYKYEFNSIRPTPENWKEVFNQQPIDGLFVESAWRGNEKHWTNQIGSYSKTSELKLNEVLAWCKSKSIPTIFWNKEDPVHFDYFLNDAKKFDYIFTTDQGVVTKYQEASANEKVFSLPFAAQPLIHNPVKDVPRDGTVCFAGTYYNQRYIERRSDMDILLRPSLDFGLDIYDRNLGLFANEPDLYRFPDIYQPAIKGRLEYDDMVKAYKQYKVFLNVNSVRHSSTMFARRVFELLSCGTPVISTFSKGVIEILGQGTVLMTESEEETRHHLNLLINNKHYWWKQSLNGMRTVMEAHTYTNRTNEVFSKVGFKLNEVKPISFMVISEIGSLQDSAYIATILRKQVNQHFEVLLFPNRDFKISGNIESQIKDYFNFTKVTILKAKYSIVMQELSNQKAHQYIAILNVNHYYGKNYLRDFALAISYKPAGILGKNSYFSTDHSGEMRHENEGVDFQHCTALHSGTIVVKKEQIGMLSHLPLPDEKMLSGSSLSMLSIDPYNFLEGGRHQFEANPTLVSGKIDI